MFLDQCDDLCGWLSSLVAIVSFGSFGVPMKGEASTACDVDPLVFQTYKSLMCFTSSFVVLLLGIEFSFTPWGIVSGFFWVPAGTAGIYAVRRAGLAISVGVWSSVIVFMSFFWGIFIFKEEVRNIFGACMAAITLVVGIWGMSIYSNISDESEVGPSSSSNPSSYGSIESQELDLIQGNGKGKSTEHSITLGTFEKGIICAVFNGLWAGTMMVPLHFAGSGTHGIHFAISFGIGALIITVILWLMRAAYHYSREGSIFDALQQLPSFHVQTMFVPGCTAGLLWSLGNMASIVSVTILGQSIGYSVVQSAMLVSGIWGIFYYHEVKGTRNIQLWFAFAIITIVGIIWLGHEHIPNSGS